MSAVELGLSPVVALCRLAVGWTRSDALCALIDNAVEAGARRVWVYTGDAFEVVDDGRGMDAAGLLDALALGSAPAATDTLSWFGLGLKAAAFSQGDRLELVSSPGGGAPFEKRTVSRTDVEVSGRYAARHESLSAADVARISAHLPAGHGTLVRIAGVRPIRSRLGTLDARRAGTVYDLFLSDGRLRLTLDGEAVAPFDVLRAAEADASLGTAPPVWDGRTVRWLLRDEDILLDADSRIVARVSATHLPLPAAFRRDEGTDGERRVRDRYSIGEETCGYYVYRNDRLVAGPLRFEGVSPRNRRHELLGFHGRIHLDGGSGSVFPVTLRKSDVRLTEDAAHVLRDLSTLVWLRRRTVTGDRAGADGRAAAP